MKISNFGRDFLLLALRIGKHKKDYVDYYIGPREISDKVDREEQVSPKRLLKECERLQTELLVQGYNKKREHYIEKMLIAMRTSVETLKGIFIPFKERFLRLYDIDLKPVNIKELENLRTEVNEAFGGDLGLEKSLAEIRERRKIRESDLIILFNKALNITKNRTKELFVDLLPHDEYVKIEIVEDLKGAVFNQYLGNFHSGIQLNPKFGIYSTALLSSAAHEGYPGHHTEFVVKEQRLYKKSHQYEHSILLLNSPKLLISEGIADLAINMLFSYQDQTEITLQNFNPNLTKEESLDKLTRQNKIKGKIHLFWYHLAYLALVERWDEKKLKKYALDFEFYGQKIVNSRIKLFTNNVFSTNLFTYNLGRNLLINKFGEFPSIRDFRTLLETSILPSDLA